MLTGRFRCLGLAALRPGRLVPRWLRDDLLTRLLTQSWTIMDIGGRSRPRRVPLNRVHNFLWISLDDLVLTRNEVLCLRP